MKAIISYFQKNPTAFIALVLLIMFIFILGYVWAMPPDIKRILGN